MSSPTNIDLVSTQASKITNVNLYTNSRAEITRVFKLSLGVAGAHQLNISGLPRAMDRDSLRVEGRGVATIHDVSISTVIPPPPNTTTTSPLLSSLQSKETKAQKSLKRVQNSLSSLNTYLGSINTSNFPADKLKDVVKEYDAIAGELDEKVLSLEEELEATRKAIQEECQRLSEPTTMDAALNTKATIVVFAESAGEIEIVLIYAVRNAAWKAGYDIRVSTTTKTKPITLVYKSLISQSTGESWDDVPLTLFTSAPTFGSDVHVPKLYPWTVYIYRPEIHGSLGSRAKMEKEKEMKKKAPRQNSFSPPGGGGGEECKADYYDTGFDDDEGHGAIPPPPPLPKVQHRGLQVSSKGNMNATFSVPGLIAIPNSGEGTGEAGMASQWHNVTITTLSLDAQMSWVCVPKKDTRVHLKAKIKNASEYTLLPGPASVYVDGSFISKSDVPLVSPEEKFECPLGLDPSIRITYHPLIKTVTRSSKFYTSNTTRHAFTQRITVQNTKVPGSTSTSNDDIKDKKTQNRDEKRADKDNDKDNDNDERAELNTASSVTNSSVNLKLIDQFPVSEDSTIRVKILQPPLVLPSINNNEKGVAKINQQSIIGGITVAPGAIARWDWDGADDDEDDEKKEKDLDGTSTANVKQLKEIEASGIGRDGRFLWDCTVPPQGKVGLTMQWEVVVPSGVNVDGL